MNILGYFVDKTKFVNLATIAILLLGLLAASRLKRESFPRVDFEVMFINTLYPGASPRDVETNVTNPIEERLKGIDGLERVVSTSQEGLSSIVVTLDPDAGQKEKIKSDVQKAVDQVTDLPEEVLNRPTIWELKTDNFGVIQISLFSDSVSETELREFGRALKKRLERLSLVSRVEFQGFKDREIHIAMDLNKLNFYQIGIAEAVNAIRARNVRIPAGDIRTADQTQSVVTEAKYQELQEISETILRRNFEGFGIRVKDVAQVEDTFRTPNELIKMNGKSGIILNVLKKSQADALRTVDQVRAEVERFRKGEGSALGIEYINDVTQVTRSSLKIVVGDALIGLALVVGVLLLFLNWQTAFWTAMGIPFALGVALILMLLTDISINNNSLIGLIIVSGLLADDSIVMAESIYYYRQQGLPPLEAARKALQTMAGPILATVTIAMVAFAPLLFFPGILGKFIFSIPMVVIVTLVGSVTEAFFILPNHLAVHAGLAQGAKATKERAWFVPVRQAYAKAVGVALRHRAWLIALFGVFFVFTLWYAGRFMKFQLFPQQRLELAVCYLEAKRGTSLQRMDAITQQFEEVLRQQPAGSVDSFTTQIGRGRNELPENENIATLVVYFPPPTEQQYDARQIVAKLREAVAKQPEIVKFSFEEQKYGPPVGRNIELRIKENDDTVRAQFTRSVTGFLGSLPGVRDIESSDKEGKNQSVLSFDYDRLAELGLQAADVGLTLRTALEGTVVSRTYTPDEKIDYRVMLQEKFRQAPKDLLRLSVLNNERRLVPIQQAVKLTQSVAPAKIEHFNYDRVTFVTANVDAKQSSIPATTQKVKTFLDDLAKQHPGFTYEIGGEASESAEAFRDVGIVFLLALGLIAIILILQFNSFLQPWIIMVSIPFGIVGVIWTFALHGLTFSFLSVIGVVGLSGIVVNDALLMIDTMNALIRKKGCRTLDQYREAAVEAAVMRFRPIAITTVTTLAGVLPTAYGWGGYVESIATMVLGLGWGLLFAALLSLFLVPGLFLLTAEFEQWLAARLPWLPIRNQCQAEE